MVKLMQAPHVHYKGDGWWVSGRRSGGEELTVNQGLGDTDDKATGFKESEELL